MKQYKKSKTARLKFASEMSKETSVTSNFEFFIRLHYMEGVEEGLSCSLKVAYGKSYCGC